jgi:uncharacterized protein (DUF169 family)
MRLSKANMHFGDATEVKVDATNSSSIAGDVVIEVYLHL